MHGHALLVRQLAHPSFADFVLRHGQRQEDALKSQPVSTNLKRQSYIDSDVKATAVAETRRKRMASVCSFMSARGEERGAGAEPWVHQAMREEAAKGWLTWSAGGVCYIAPDAFKAGNEDTLCVQFWHASQCTGGWLPPQVALLFAHSLASFVKQALLVMVLGFPLLREILDVALHAQPLPSPWKPSRPSPRMMLSCSGHGHRLVHLASSWVCW